MRRIIPSLDAAFDLLERRTNLERGVFPVRELRLDRMRSLLEIFDRPERSFVSIHVAGSKGKGSTSRCIAAILEAAGMPCGLYASPHVELYTERIGRAGKPFPDGDYLRAITDIFDRIDRLPPESFPGGAGPTTFELLTLLAFLLFREHGLGHAVVETGIGGRLDATNVIVPAASVLTPVEREHTDYLGNTLRQIAGEKAGIIKQGVPVLSSRQSADAEEVFRRTARERNAPFGFLPEEIAVMESAISTAGTRVRLRLRDGFDLEASLPLIGSHQAENAALAVLTVHRLFPAISPEMFRRGLATVTLPGRFEIVRNVPPLVLDAAHTPGSTERVLDTFRSLFPEPGVLLFGSVEGKDSAAMADLLAARFAAVVVTTPGTFKRSDPASVYRLFRERNPETLLVPDPGDAVDLALARSGGVRPILVAGSFYLVGEVRKRLRQTDAPGAPAQHPDSGGRP